MRSDNNLPQRQTVATLGRAVLFLSLLFAILSLAVLFGTIINQAGGYTVTQFSKDPRTVADKPIAELTTAQLVRVLRNNITGAAYDNLIVDTLEQRDVASRERLIRTVLAAPPETSVSDLPLAELSSLEIVQNIIEERFGKERVRQLAETDLATASQEQLADFARGEFLAPVSESDLTGGPKLEDVEFETLLTIINERFSDAQFAKYDVSELANESPERIIEVIRSELVGTPDESVLLGKPLADASREELAAFLRGRFSEETYAAEVGVFVAETVPHQDLEALVRAELLQPIDATKFSPDKPIDALTSREMAAAARANLDDDRQLAFATLALEPLGRDVLMKRVEADVLVPSVAKSWGLFRSIIDKAGVEREAAANYPGVPVVFRAWVTPQFLTKVMSSRAEESGIRTALLGSLWMLMLTILIALPIGLGAAIYLEELAGKSRLSQLIQINIYNLAGIPSIIYGMLGLTLFVRTLGDLMGITSGAAFGISDTNGRTILSASLTMALLILPLIIVNTQEAIRAVPSSLREASYGIGQTKLQTIWHHVLPSALPGILTGSILAMSRAIGETAPLIVIGASTFIAVDPNGPFSKFTVLPIQIYKWTSLPDETFRNVAAAAIVVLLVVLVSLNLSAILLRNRFRKRL